MERYPGNMPSAAISGNMEKKGVTSGATLSTAMQRSLSANSPSANSEPAAVPPPDAKFTLDEDEKVD
jgi:hypothetical protein